MMSMPEFIISVAALPFVGGLIGWILARKKNDAEVSKIKAEVQATEIANVKSMIELYSKIAEDLKVELQEALKEAQELRRDLQDAQKQCAELKHDLQAALDENALLKSQLSKS